MHTVCIVYLHMYIYNIQDLKKKKLADAGGRSI